MTPADLARLRDRRVHVIGLAATEGAAVARFLWRAGVRRLVVHDLAEGEALRAAFMRLHVGLPRAEREALWSELDALPIERRLGADYLGGLDEAEAIFAGQAWYLYEANRAPLEAARARGVPIHGLMDLYFGLAAARILAVTGSNGKSTTSRLAERMLRFDAVAREAAPDPARPPRAIWFAGNDRHGAQVLDDLSRMTAADVLILEVSNRHLLGIAPRPWIGVVTNVLPNHLDEHGGSFAAYAAVKRRLVERIGPEGWAVLNAGDAASVALAEGLDAPILWFGPRAAGDAAAWLDGRGGIRLRGVDEAVARVEEVRVIGAHNHANVLAAAAAAFAAGAAADAIGRAIRAFEGLRHRLQFVWAAGDVHYYDDLNATSPQATVAALDALQGIGRPVVLIAGGDDKGLDFGALAARIRSAARRVLLLPGPGGERLAAALADGGPGAPPIARHDDFREAVADAVADARPGEAVLLSPACPYFFRRFYLDGGEEVGFRQLLRELATERSIRRRAAGPL